VNSIDRSLEKINYVKLLGFLFAFILITLALITMLILPNIKRYRVAKSKYNQAFVHKTRVQAVLDQREEELKKLLSANRKIFDSFGHKFSQKEFEVFANKFFSKTVLKEVKQFTHKKEFKVYELNVTSSLKTPVNFYKFLDGLNHYQNIIQADFPIDLKSNNEIIHSTFKIKVYGLIPESK
jgi:5-carboxymethyl-2-hydroxymuconate isomerase